MKKLFLLTGFLFSVPLVAFAQPRDLAELVNLIIGVANPLFILIISLIVIAVLWGLARTVFALGGEEGVKEGKRLMFWGLIALFLSVSFWGVVSILSNTFL